MSPLNKKGSWGITDSWCLSLCSPNFKALQSFISYIEPIYGSTILNKAWMIDDLPAPVLPTIPTFSPSLIVKVIPFNTKGNSALYLREKF